MTSSIELIRHCFWVSTLAAVAAVVLGVVSVVNSKDSNPTPKQNIPVVTPGLTPGQAPSDAVILFDGTNLDAFRPGKALWSVENGLLESGGKKHPLKTRERFADVQFHIEWIVDSNLPGFDRRRKSSTRIVFADKWNLRIPSGKGALDSLIEGIGTPDGYPSPLFNAYREANKWQSYDVIFEAPRFKDDKNKTRPGRLTVILNGVMIYHNQHLPMHGIDRILTSNRHIFTAPISLYDDSNCVRFRNMWVREFESRTNIN